MAQTLSEYGEKAPILPGGCDLITSMHAQNKSVKYLVNLASLNELSFVKYDEHYLRIGAIVTLKQVEKV